MSSKTNIYNLALSALLLSRQVVETESEKVTNEVRVLNQLWDSALASVLQQLDLDSLSETIDLELIEELEDDTHWAYVYKYPSRCIFLRRIKTVLLKDTIRSRLELRVGIRNGAKVIYTNEYQAQIECICNDVSLAYISPSTELAIAYKLAYLACPLLVGKGAKTLREEIKQNLLIYMMDAKETDVNENFIYETPEQQSEYVAARLE